MTVLGPYESRSIYRALHSGPLGQKTVAFRNQVWNAQHPHERDGAAVCSPQAVTATISTPRPQPAPSPSTLDGGAR